MIKKFLIGILVISSAYSANLTDTVNNFNAEWDRYVAETQHAEKQVLYNKAKEQAKVLLGYVDTLKIKTYDRINSLCELFSKKITELETANTTEADEKKSLRTKRDIDNYKEICKFLKVSSKLIDAVYESPDIIDMILQKIPEFVPLIAEEITVMLRVLESFIKAPDDIDTIVTKMREFASSSEDGTRILSPLVSAVIEVLDSADLKKILAETDFSDLNNCKYLKIR